MTNKRFNYHIDEVGVYYYICDNTKKGDAKIVLELNNKFDASEVCDLLNDLHKEKEFWKSMACDQTNFNSILLNELDIAMEQGYEVSDPFKKLMEDRK